MFASYFRLVGRPGVPHILVATLLTRLSTPVLSLALMLAIVERTGSYGVASLALAGHALSLALLAPVAGRLADQHRPRTVLVGFLGVHAMAQLAAVAAVAVAAPGPVVLVAVVLLGASTPPATAVARAAWPRLVPTESLPTAYAVDNATNELMFIVGPVVFSVLLVVLPAQVIMAVAGAAFVAGTVLLALAPPVRDKAPDERQARPSGRLGPLAHRPVLIVLIVAMTATVAFGCLRVGTLAAATAAGSPGWAGILMSLLSVGALAGGLLYGARRWPGSGRRLLIVLSFADAAILVTGAVPAGLQVLAGAVVLMGLLQGARDTLLTSLLADQAPATQRTEAFALLNTFMWLGYGVGTAVAGQLTGPTDGGGPAFLLAAAAALLGALLIAAGSLAKPHTVPTTSAASTVAS
jgi:MFS family permease